MPFFLTFITGCGRGAADAAGAAVCFVVAVALVVVAVVGGAVVSVCAVVEASLSTVD